MKILKRILIGIVALILIIIGGVYVFLQGTKPNYQGEFTLQGLHAQVEVMYDPYGVPHIYAQDADDAYFALGFVHAQDRLFQMEMIRRAAAGRLAEVLGKDLLPTDRFFRTLGLNIFAKEHARTFLSNDSIPFQKAALSYQKGVNAFIEKGKTPLEFTIAGIPKTPFTPEDIFLASGFTALGLAEGTSTDPVLNKIKNEWGAAYLNDLAVQTPEDAVYLHNFKGPAKSKATDSLISALHNAMSKLPVSLWSGSNSWVISGSRTASGLPILANDTHMGFVQPAVWFEAHLEYPGFALYGHYLAGTPFALLGNNRFCAWGLTMFENDDIDFYNEVTDDQHPNQVLFAGQWENLSIREEVIHVKNESDEILQVKTSRHGPIINGINAQVIPGNPQVSFWWLMNAQRNETLQAFYKLNHAQDFEEARLAASQISSPGLNLMYGDAAGNIAWWAVAKIPKRAPHVNTKFFLDGSSGKDEILGYYDFDKNPQSINPPWGFVYTANNQPDSVDGVLYPGYYYPRARAGRIEKLLSEEKKWTVEDMKKINLDVTSAMHVDIAKEMVAALNEINDTSLADLVSILSGWNGDHQLNQIEPSVYYNLLSHTMDLMMKDELGAPAYASIMGTALPRNSYDKLIRNAQSPWWDDVTTTDKKETRADIIQEAAKRTLTNLKETSGPNPADWTWGKIHTITHPHPLGAVKPLDKLFNVGPFAVPGGSEVINNLAFDVNTSGYFPVTSGPALRKITDFGDLNHGQTVSPSGQSGHVMSSFYQDQAEMFVSGKFRLMMMKREEIQSSSTTLLLKPLD